jgi:hypothetical protein
MGTIGRRCIIHTGIYSSETTREVDTICERVDGGGRGC